MSPSRKPTVERVARFFDQERRGLVAYLRRRVRALEEMDAEDVVSEVALRLFERPDLVDEIENLAGYVMRALQRRVVDWARARKATVALDERRAHDAGRVAEDADFRRRLLAALAALPPPQREVWIETELEGRTFKELAERWSVPLGTLLARKHRATKALRSALRDLWDQDS